jgi:hypothetical protein
MGEVILMRDKLKEAKKAKGSNEMRTKMIKTCMT